MSQFFSCFGVSVCMTNLQNNLEFLLQMGHLNSIFKCVFISMDIVLMTAKENRDTVGILSLSWFYSEMQKAFK